MKLNNPYFNHDFKKTNSEAHPVTSSSEYFGIDSDVRLATDHVKLSLGQVDVMHHLHSLLVSKIISKCDQNI